jgi:hypothetical protein
MASSDYFSDVAKTDMMRVIVALTTEVYAMRDRQKTLENILIESGTDLALLDEKIEAAAFDETRLAERDAFVSRVFAAMASPTMPDGLKT